jgi:excisionase family DNA binding protein
MMQKQNVIANRQVFRSVDAVARRWGVSRFTVIREIERGKVRSVRIGRRRMIHVDELARIESGVQA